MKRTAPSRPSPAEEDDLREICAALAALDDAGRIRCFLDEILTPRERADLASRWRLMRLLLEGRTQRSIAAELGLSLCKITRGSRELKRPDSVCRSLLSHNAPTP